MSTERKPGSRAIRDPFTGGRGGQPQRMGTPPPTTSTPNPKGSTKTVSPRRGFKKRPRK
jgi:hypothetical protein